MASLHCSNLQGSLHREAVNRIGLGQEVGIEPQVPHLRNQRRGRLPSWVSCLTLPNAYALYQRRRLGFWAFTVLLCAGNRRGGRITVLFLRQLCGAGHLRTARAVITLPASARTVPTRGPFIPLTTSPSFMTRSVRGRKACRLS